MKKKSLFTGMIAIAALLGLGSVKYNTNRAARAADDTILASDIIGWGTSGQNASNGSFGNYTINTSSGMNSNGVHLRIYANATFTIAHASAVMSEINLTFTASGTANYGPSKMGLNSNMGGSYTYEGSVGTWTGEASSVVFKATAQARVSKIEVTLKSGTAPISYTVSFDSNGGSGSMEGTTCGASYKLPECTFTAPGGYGFSKWALNSASGDQYSVGDTVSGISDNVTFFAIWKSDADAANSVVTKINDIKNPLILNTSAIETARDAYNSLTESQKTLVSNYADLVSAEEYVNTYVLFTNSLTSDSSSAVSSKVNSWNIPSELAISGFKNCYSGKESTVKLGSGSAGGSFKLGLSSNLVDEGNIITNVNVVAKQYGSDSSKLSVSGSNQVGSDISLDSSYAEYSFDVSSQKVSEITVSSVSARSYIYAVKVSYECSSVSLNSSLIIEGELSKNSYYEDETIDLSGLTVYASFSDGAKVDVTSAVSLENDGVLSTGQTSVQVTYTYSSDTATGSIEGFTVVAYESVNYGLVGQDIPSSEVYDGEYYLAYVEGTDAKVWNGNLTDADNAYISASVVDADKIASSKPLEECIVTIESIKNGDGDVTGYSLKTSSGSYVGANSDKLGSSETAVVFDIEIDNNGYALIKNQNKSSKSTLFFNTSFNKIRYYDNPSSSVKGLMLFKKGAAPTLTNNETFRIFVVSYMHLDDISTTNTADTGACRGEEGYFAAAMVAFNNLTPKQRELVLEDAYVDTYNRLSAWADANGKTLDINDDGEVVVVSQLIHNLDNRLAGFDDEDSSSVILAITTLSAGALGALYLFKKKRVA